MAFQPKKKRKTKIKRTNYVLINFMLNTIKSGIYMIANNQLKPQTKACAYIIDKQYKHKK